MGYLYGASVQGIQSFVFETNELREIVGASELVEQICTIFFQRQVKNYKPANRIMEAAGNIKYLFEEAERAACEDLVLNFPKEVMTMAPGITISQAIIKIGDELKQEDIQQLEAQLKIQRNQPIAPHGQGLMITERSRKTGKAGVAWDKYGLVVSKGQLIKRKVSDEGEDSLLIKLLVNSEMEIDGSSPSQTLTRKKQKDFYSYDVKDIVGGKEQSWLAVVHADGNNLGKLLIKMSNAIKENKTKETFQTFSETLNIATVLAASDAYREVVESSMKKEDGISKLPIRPVVLGGDDLTMIIRGDLAVDYTSAFLKNFEIYTKKYFKDFAKNYLKESASIQGLFEQGLTACAGIAYIKPNYPFHYGVDLAESLCKYSKQIAKGLNPNNTPSCLAFHKVHSSFIENYGRIIKQELTATPIYKSTQDLQQKSIQFNYGPYFLHDKDTPKEYATIATLKDWVAVINEDAAPRGPLRNWLSQLTIDASRAEQLLERIKSLNGGYCKKLAIFEKPFTSRTHTKQDKTEETIDYTHLFEVMALSRIASRR